MSILYLFPMTLGNTAINQVIPDQVQEIVKNTSHFIVENLKTTRRYLRKMDASFNIDGATFFELNKHTRSEEICKFIAPLKQGNNIGIISEAGVPCLADPGNIVVQIGHEQNIQVVPLTGPSSIVLAMIASGMNGQNFAFNGYLPVQKSERINKIKQLEKRSRNECQSQLFMETPFRNMALLEDCLKNCHNNTRLLIACDITCSMEFIKTKTIQQWKKSKLPELHKRPTIFGIHA